MDEPTDHDRVVYLAYGSNTDPARLDAYIRGSGPDSPFGPHRGSSDTEPVRVLDAGWVRGRLRFAGESRRWGGGVAVADAHHIALELFVVRYDLSRRQLVDLISQENGDRAVWVDWAALAVTGGSHRCTTGPYDMVVAPDGGTSGLLITASELPEPRPPSMAYAEIVRRGLSVHLGVGEADRYLARAGAPAITDADIGAGPSTGADRAQS